MIVVVNYDLGRQKYYYFHRTKKLSFLLFNSRKMQMHIYECQYIMKSPLQWSAMGFHTIIIK